MLLKEDISLLPLYISLALSLTITKKPSPRTLPPPTYRLVPQGARGSCLPRAGQQVGPELTSGQSGAKPALCGAWVFSPAMVEKTQEQAASDFLELCAARKAVCQEKCECEKRV